jgi:thioredoxin 1
MAETKNNKTWMLVFWTVFAVVVLGGLVYYSWNRTDEPQKADEVKTEDTTDQTTENTAYKCDQQSTMLTDTDKLGVNEVAITACNFDVEVLQAKGVVVVDAYASWCPHCQKLSPEIDKIANTYVGRIKVGKLNANNQDPAMKDNFDFAVANGLEGYPTVWIYKDGELVDSFSGAKTYDEIKPLIDKQL